MQICIFMMLCYDARTIVPKYFTAIPSFPTQWIFYSTKRMNKWLEQIKHYPLDD